MKKTVMLVDDEIQILKTLKRLFFNCPYEIVYMTSAMEALEYLKNEPIDLIITDVRMPQMDGIEFLKIVKGLYPSTIRVVLSGYTDSSAIYKALEMNLVKMYIFKPWDSDELVKTVEQLFELEDLLRSKKIMEVINNFDSMPSVPALYQKIEQMIREDVDVDKIAKLIESDQTSAAKVLRIANSVFYGGKTGSISQSIMYIGLTNIKNLLLSSLVFESNGKHRQAIERLWENAAKTNQLAHHYYRKIFGKKIPDVCASAGLLHNIGMAIFICNYESVYGKILDEYEEKHEELLNIEMSLFGLTHQEIGAFILNWWDLPLPNIEAALYHHNPINDQVINKELLCIIHISNHFAWENMSPNYSMSTCVEECCQFLEITVEEAGEMAQELMSKKV